MIREQWMLIIIILLAIIVICETIYILKKKKSELNSENITKITNEVRTSLRKQYIAQAKLLKDEKTLFKDIDHLVSQLPVAFSITKQD